MSRISVVAAAALLVSMGCERESEPSEGVVTVDGVQLRYVVEGAGNPVLVVGSAVYYPRTFSRRLKEHFRLHYVDLRHFVPSDPGLEVDAITMDAYANDIDHVRQALGFETMAVLGHSIHGNIALEYARRYPQHVSHVIVIASPPVGMTETSQAANEYWESQASDERKRVLQRNWEQLGADSLSELPPGDAVVAAYVANGPMYWYDETYDASPLWDGMHVNATVMNELFALFNEYDIGQGPGQITSPVFVAMGRYDYVVPHFLWDDQREKLPNMSYHLFANSGHTPQLEEPDLFDEALIEWFGNR